MVKLNRTTEYGLLAISYIREKSTGQLASAREISQHFDLPFEILAKTLQKLKEQGIIASTYGTRGGYVLARDLSSLSLAEFLHLMEGPSGVVSCAGHQANSGNSANLQPPCEYSQGCSIRPMMSHLNRRVHTFLSSITIDELTRSHVTAPVVVAEALSAPLFPQGDEP